MSRPRAPVSQTIRLRRGPVTVLPLSNDSDANSPEPEAPNAALEDLPGPSAPDRIIILAWEVADLDRLVVSHPVNREQMEGGPTVGHGGVRNLSDDQLVMFGGPQGSDPIAASRFYRPGDSLALPGSGIYLAAGHHRVNEIARRVRRGTLDSNTPIEVLKVTP